MDGSSYAIFWAILLLILTVVLISRRRKGPIFAPHSASDIESFKGCLWRIVLAVVWLFVVPKILSNFDESAEYLTNGTRGRVVGLNTRNVFGGKCADCGVLRLDRSDNKYSFPRSADVRYGDSIFKQNDTVWRVREVNGQREVTFLLSDKDD